MSKRESVFEEKGATNSVEMNYPFLPSDSLWDEVTQDYETKTGKRKQSLQVRLSAVLYLLRTGWQWRMLPAESGDWELVYPYYRKRIDYAVLESQLYKLVGKVCKEVEDYGKIPTIFADGAFKGEAPFYRNKTIQWKVVNKKGGCFRVLPKGWVAERSIACLTNFRRLAKDYEENIECT